MGCLSHSIQCWYELRAFAAGGCGLEGTRITVDRIATLYKQGQSAEGISQTYPHLSMSQIYTALAYYHANREEIESVLAAENRDIPSTGGSTEIPLCAS